jgi:hypothetical protein
VEVNAGGGGGVGDVDPKEKKFDYQPRGKIIGISGKRSGL